jgi:hypothetical protein
MLVSFVWHISNQCFGQPGETADNDTPVCVSLQAFSIASQTDSEQHSQLSETVAVRFEAWVGFCNSSPLQLLSVVLLVYAAPDAAGAGQKSSRLEVTSNT